MWVIFVVRGRVIRTRGVSAEDFTELREIMGSGRMASVMSYCADNYDIGIADVSTAGVLDRNQEIPVLWGPYKNKR